MSRIRWLVLCLVAIVAMTSGCSLFTGGEETPPKGDLDGPILSPNNLVKNPFFEETDEDDQVVGWTLSLLGPSTGYTAQVDDDALGGRSAVRVSGDGEEGRSIIVQRNVPATDLRNKRLKMSVWYKGTDVVKGPTMAEHFIRVEFFKQVDGSLTSAGASRVTHAPLEATDWVLLTNEFDVYPETDIIWVSISLRNSTGTAWWTGVDISEVTD